VPVSIWPAHPPPATRVTDTDVHPELRPLLFSIAYRMIGSVSEAEDIVQEAFLRYHRAQPRDVENPKAYLSAVTTRLAIDHLRSARAQREEYVGPWLPEPLLTDESAPDPAEQAEVADSLSLAFLVLLERLSPVERAAFLLREVFAYPYDEIAEVIGKSEANARQLVSRARRHVDAERPRFDVSREAHEELTDRFVTATQDGDVEGLVELLAADAYTYTDGGGKAQAARRPIHGRERVARFMVGIARPERGAAGVTLHAVEVNGRPGRLMVDGNDNPVGVLALDIADGLIQAVRIVVNPDKLTHLSAP
jgi:RNA polymerase sigma-70 factor (ECF subfamily)